VTVAPTDSSPVLFSAVPLLRRISVPHSRQATLTTSPLGFTALPSTACYPTDPTPAPSHTTSYGMPYDEYGRMLIPCVSRLKQRIYITLRPTATATSVTAAHRIVRCIHRRLQLWFYHCGAWQRYGQCGVAVGERWGIYIQHIFIAAKDVAHREANWLDRVMLSGRTCVATPRVCRGGRGRTCAPLQRSSGGV
jgi:hypothetical protein